MRHFPSFADLPSVIYRECRETPFPLLIPLRWRRWRSNAIGLCQRCCPRYGGSVGKPKPRKQVSRPRKVRIDIAMIADMVTYPSEPDTKRASLHSFLVASTCTLARPDSVVDICVAPDREQWYAGPPTLDLNPFGREQTNEYQPVIPAQPILQGWLAAELDRYQRLDADMRKGSGLLINHYGRSILDVDTFWRMMLRELKLSTTREWKPYAIRHSLATLLRDRGVHK